MSRRAERGGRGRALIGLNVLGALFLLAALLLIGRNLFLDRSAEKRSREAEQLMELAMAADTSAPDDILHPETPMPEIQIRGQRYIGILEIDALGLKLPVISWWSYDALETAPARYAGSAYQNDMVIAAHNYSCHFGKLKDIQIGDTVRFIDVKGNCFTYQAAEIEQLSPEETERMLTGDWDLTLFTCTAGGTSRVTVRCSAIAEKSTAAVPAV